MNNTNFNRVNVAGYSLKELESFFIKTKYSEQTKLVLIDLLVKKKKPADVARIYNITPQRINNIKTDFIKEYKNNNSFILFEGKITAENVDELKEFAKKCKYLKIITSEPTRKIYL